MKCQNCGYEETNVGVFCPKCGVKFAPPDKNNEEINTAISSDISSNADIGKDTNSPQKPINDSKQKKKSKRVVLILSAVVGVIAIATVVLTLCFGNFFSNLSNKEPTNNSIETETTENILEYIEKAETLANESKYEEAIATLETAEQLYGSNSLITLKKEEINKRKGLEDLAILEADAKYKECLEYINNNLSDFTDDEDILVKKNMYTTKYREQIISDAESAMKSSGYESAVEILQDALDILKDDPQISSKITEYKSYEPIRLENIKVTASNDGYDFCSSKSDPRGETNTDVLYLESYVEFYVGKQYSKFTATVDPAEYFKTSEYAGTQLRILADDEVVYQSPTITYKTNDLSVSADIKNAEYMRLELVYVGGTKFSEHWDADDILICNPCVIK